MTVWMAMLGWFYQTHDWTGFFLGGEKFIWQRDVRTRSLQADCVKLQCFVEWIGKCGTVEQLVQLLDVSP